MTFRRVMILLLITVVVSAFAVPALAADYSVLVPPDHYPFVWIPEFDYSFTTIPWDFSITPDPSLTINVWLDGDIYYSCHWEYYSDPYDRFWFFGNMSLVDESVPDNGLPFYVSFFEGDLLLVLRGGHSEDPGTYVSITQGPPSDPSDDNLGPASITSSLGSVLGWWVMLWGSFISGGLSPLLSLFAIAVAIPLILLVVKFIRKFL